MKIALLRLFGSMKFWTLLLGMLTALGAKYGFAVDPEVYWSIVGLTGVLLGAQGLNDHGKGKAEVESRTIQSGFAQLRVMSVLAAAALWTCILLALVGLVGCSWLKSETKHAASTIVDCTTASAKDLSKQFGPVVDSVLTSALSDTGKLDWSSVKAATRSFATDTGGCVLAAAIERLKRPRDQGAPYASPLAVDLAELDAGWTALRREQFGGRTFALGDGS